jgi:DnaJ family protein C protein 7
MGLPKERGTSSAGESLDEDYSVNEGSKLSADGKVEQSLFVFGECATAPHSWFAASTAQSDANKLDSSNEGDAACSSERQDLSAPEDGRCGNLEPSPGSSNRDAPSSRPHEVHETGKASNTAPSSIASQDDIPKVSLTKLPDVMQAQSTVVAVPGLGEWGSFDEKSFALHDHNVSSKDKGVVKAMSMNRRAVKPKKFSSARQVSSLRTVNAADTFSGNMIPESNSSLQQSGKVGFRFEDSGIRPEEANAAQTTESSHDRTRLTFGANLESFGHSDLTFASSTSDQSRLHSQRQQTKKSSEGMPVNNTKFVQSLPTSAISLAHTEVSASQPNTVFAAQWTEYSKAEPTTVTCTKTEKFGYQEDCETWRIRCLQHLSSFVTCLFITQVVTYILLTLFNNLHLHCCK